MMNGLNLCFTGQYRKFTLQQRHGSIGAAKGLAESLGICKIFKSPGSMVSAGHGGQMHLYAQGVSIERY